MTIMEEKNEIEAIGQRYAHIRGIAPLADQAVRNGWSLAEFRRAAEDLMPASPTPRHRPLDIPAKDAKRYSLLRALVHYSGGKGVLDGIEGELSRDVELRSKQSPGGFWVPHEIMAGNQERSLIAGTGTLGGMVVSTPNLGSEFIELLRNRAQVVNLGARVLILDNPVTIPRQNAAGTANWVGETVAATLSVGNFSQVTLAPLGISAWQQYSNQLLATSNPGIDQLVRDDILQIVNIEIDRAALHGSGGTQPTGIAGTAGVGTVNLATNGQALGNSTAYPALISLETAIASANADSGPLAFLMRSSHRGSLKTTQRFSNTDSPVFETTGGPEGICCGYRAAVSNSIATNLTTGTANSCSAIFLADWSQLMLGRFNGASYDVTIDPYTNAQNGVTRVLVRTWISTALRHPESFAILGGII